MLFCDGWRWHMIRLITCFLCEHSIDIEPVWRLRRLQPRRKRWLIFVPIPLSTSNSKAVEPVWTRLLLTVDTFMRRETVNFHSFLFDYCGSSRCRRGEDSTTSVICRCLQQCLIVVNGMHCTSRLDGPSGIYRLNDSSKPICLFH